MGRGIEMAKQINPETARALENLRDQLLIVFLKRLGGEVTIPVEEVDDTGGDLMTMELTKDRSFRLRILKKD